KDYITRSHPDNRGAELGRVVARNGSEIVVEVATPLIAGDGIAFEAAQGSSAQTVGFTIEKIRTLNAGSPMRQAITSAYAVEPGSRVVRSFDSTLMTSARESFSGVTLPVGGKRTRLDARVFGSAGSPLKIVFVSGD